MKRRPLSILALAAVALMLSACASSPKMSKSSLAEAARLNTRVGIDYAQKGQYTAALDRLQKALKQDEAYAGAHGAIAFVYQALAVPAKAERHYRRALALDGEDPVLKNNFGVFLCSQNKADEAQRYFIEAANSRHYGTPASAWTNAGVCLRDRDPVRAEQYLREALRVEPQASEALAQLAVLSFKQKNFLSARAFLQRYDLSQRATAELLYVATRTEVELGDQAAAEQYAERLSKEFPMSSEAASLKSLPTP
ncbi:MAG TPA: type IV pilus biogenesis/stability protein PilW [Solimonas sp.]